MALSKEYTMDIEPLADGTIRVTTDDPMLMGFDIKPDEKPELVETLLNWVKQIPHTVGPGKFNILRYSADHSRRYIPFPPALVRFADNEIWLPGLGWVKYTGGKAPPTDRKLAKIGVRQQGNVWVIEMDFEPQKRGCSSKRKKGKRNRRGRV